MHEYFCCTLDRYTWAVGKINKKTKLLKLITYYVLSSQDVNKLVQFLNSTEK